MKPMLKAPPPREEWHFDAVPASQRWACYYYEFARSHETVSRNVVSRRHLTREVQDYLYENHLTWLRTRSFHDRCQAGHLEFSFIPHICPEFPEVPWQGIALKTRAQRLRELPDVAKEIYRPITEAGLRAIACDPASERFEEFLVHHDRPREFAVVPLDWSLSNKALREVFGHYLKHRPMLKAPRKATGRRYSPLDGLHALAALRLKKHYGNTAKVLAAIQDDLVDLPYSDDAAVRAAVRRARKTLAAF